MAVDIGSHADASTEDVSGDQDTHVLKYETRDAFRTQRLQE